MPSLIQKDISHKPEFIHNRRTFHQKPRGDYCAEIGQFSILTEWVKLIFEPKFDDSGFETCLWLRDPP